MSIVIYKGKPQKHSWVTYMLRRIDKNKNNLIAVVGKTGSGKTYSAIAICELMSKQNGVPFTIDNVIFTLKELMALINSGKLKKGSCVIFDEPQVSISNREFMSEANKVFNFLLSTFRHRNLTLFFCSPFEDLLDKSVRKLFHAKFLTQSIDYEKQETKLRPKITEYNSNRGKFYEKFLRLVYRSGKKNRVIKLKTWSVPKPSEDFVELYEQKKMAFTNKLNSEIEAKLNRFEAKKEAALQPQQVYVNQNDTSFPNVRLTERQLKILELWNSGVRIQKEMARLLNTKQKNISDSMTSMRAKGIRFGLGVNRINESPAPQSNSNHYESRNPPPHSSNLLKEDKLLEKIKVPIKDKK